MKQKEMKMVAYVAPEVSIYEIHSEGALCESGIYNDNGLRNIQGDDVNDESGDWN